MATYFIPAAVLAISACQPKVQLPIRTEMVVVPVTVDVLVCHARAAAAEQRLSFHYGTFKDDGGPKATVRLLGDAFELELVKWDGRPQYELRGYDMSADGSARQRANQAFEQFKGSLVERLPRRCA